MTAERIEVSGAAATIFRDAPKWDGLRCAAIGGLAFESAAAGTELLQKVAQTLRAEGFAGLLGPMDGDTWHRYRVVAETDGSPPFALEPQSSPYDLDGFTGAGFVPISEYVSSRAPLAATISGDPVTMPGIIVTAWDGRGAEQLISELFEMSGSAFSSNHFFKPIGLDAFLDLYRPILPLLDPRHILFAHDPNERLVGFLFGMPDRLAREKPAAILKTYASGLRGVGHLLADTYHRRALDLGFDEVIHALMQENNVSRDRSARHNAKIFRRYALLGLKL